jgi:hypothetical protein
MATKVLAFAGSTRADSFNRKLAQTAAIFAEKAGATVTVVDLRDHPLPLYDGDLEESAGPPEEATTLYELFKSHDALLISSHEAFAEDGSLVDEKLAGRVAAAMKSLVRTSSRLKENDNG